MSRPKKYALRPKVNCWQANPNVLTATIYQKFRKGRDNYIRFFLEAGTISFKATAPVPTLDVMVRRKVAYSVADILVLTIGFIDDHRYDPSRIGRRAVRKAIAEFMLDIIQEENHPLRKQCEQTLLSWIRDVERETNADTWMPELEYQVRERLNAGPS